MSRLDSAIRRLEAQRACLDFACEAIAGRPGPVFELGLGNGRTYDHLRSRLGEARAIYVFERKVAAHPDCIPPDERLYLGDFAETLPRAAAEHSGRVVLAHADMGSGDEAANARLAAFVSQALAPALAPGALVLSDQTLTLEGAETLDLPQGVAPGRYHLYRVPSAV
ncbi:MAG: class I SAM-dependent methyltransferase [Pseudomonadota bacterium]